MSKQATHHRKGSRYDGFDVLVIGSGMGGLAAAALLAQEGRKVLVLERHVQPGGLTQSFSRAGFEWSVGLHYIGEVVKPTSVMRRLFDDITDGQLQWNPLPEVYNRIGIGNQLYDQVAGTEGFRKQALAYFPGHEEGLDTYLGMVHQVARLSKSYYMEKMMPEKHGRALRDEAWHAFRDLGSRTTGDVLGELFGDPKMIAYLCGHYGDYGLPPGESSFVYHAGVARHYHDGAAYPVGGSRAIFETVAPVIKKTGGQVITNAPVAAINVEGGKAHGVVLQDGTEIHAPLVISAAGLHTTRRLLGDHGDALCRADQLPGHSIAHVGLFLGLDRDDADLGLTGSNIWAHPSADLDGNATRYKADPNAPFPWCFITFPSAKDASWAARHPGKATIEITAPAYYEVFASEGVGRYGRRSADYQALKQQMGKRLLEVLLQFVPQIEPHIAHMEVSTPLSTVHFTGHPKGQILGLPNTPERLSYDWLRAPTPVRGLFLTGQDLVSDGVSTAMLAGAFTASSVLGEDVISKVFARAAGQ